MKRGARGTFLGIQWDTGTWDSIPGVSDSILETVGTAPIHWNFPALPPESPRRTRSWIEKTLGPRIAAGTDAAFPMGFAGACHPFLSLDELDKELSWCLKNPWGTGLADILGIRASVLLPRMPDFARPQAIQLYSSHGFTVMGVCRAGAHARFSSGGMDCFTCWRLSLAAPLPLIQASLREIARCRGDMFLMLDLTGATLTTLPEALGAMRAAGVLPRGEEATLLGKGPGAVPGAGPGPDGIDWSVFPDPVLRKKLAATAALARKKRKKNDDYRELLGRLSPGPAEGPDPAAAPVATGIDTRLVAQMMGDVVLAGSVFDVKLAGGRFCGIVRGGRDLLPVRPAVSYLRVGGKTWSFQPRSSFSFERDAGTGLREEMAIDSRDGSSLVIEYSFRDDHPMLEIDAEVRWPVIPAGLRVEEHAPFVIALLRLDDGADAVVRAVSPNDMVTSVRIPVGSWTVVPGVSHRVPLRDGPALVLRSAQPEPAGWSAMSFRVVRERRGRFLEVNPFGGWTTVPADAVSGLSERFSLLMGFKEDAPRPGERR